MRFKGWKVAVLLAFALAGQGALAATPGVDDIYRAAKSGHMQEAQQMVDQVLAEHPNSAKAHFVAAEIYAREGKFAIAKKELATAEQLKPGLPFVKPQAVAALKGFLGMPGGASAGGGFPFGALVLVILAIGVIIAVIKLSAARAADRAGRYPGNGPGQQAAGQPHPGGYPSGGMGGGLGSGIVGGLATGAALGAGMVAGEALAHRLIDDDHPAASGSEAAPAPNTDMGGADFGIDDAGGWDDNTTFADFGDSDFGDLGGGDWG